MEWARQNFAHLASWAPIAFAAIAILGGAGVWWLGRGRRLLVPTGRRQRFYSFICLSFVGFGLVGIAVARGPMSPLVTTAQRLRRGIGQQVPDLGFHLASDDSAHHLAEFRGKVVLVNLWATWCPPCRTELPTLNRLQAAYKNRGVVIVTLSDEPRGQMRDVVAKHSPETVNGYMAAFGWLDIETFRPFSLVIDRNGVLQDYFFGSQEYATFEAKIREYL